jgi:hypothetical protein
MKRLESINLISIRQSSPLRYRSLFDLIRTASSKRIAQVVVAVTVAWLPAAILSGVQGASSLKSFFTDVATQSRLLVVVPLLILYEPQLRARLEKIARQFINVGLISDPDLPKFQADWSSCQRLGQSPIARITLPLLVYLLIGLSMPYLGPDVFHPWCRGEGWLNLSRAGVWFLLVSNPILFYLLLDWIWRTMLWARFLAAVSRLNLLLIPSHPDQVGGLGFVESSLKGQFPFGFCIGVIVAGGVANRIVHGAQSLLSFKYMPLLVIGTVLFLCVAPLCVFMGKLLATRRRGVFEYGPFAAGLGQRFEDKWLCRGNQVSEDALQEQDFSATVDLYSVVANVYRMRLVPFDRFNLYTLLLLSLTPAIPVALVALPFDVLMREAVKLLF